MKIYYYPVLAIALLTMSSIYAVSAQEAGKTAFKQTCGACHTIGKGKLVGPDLINVGDRRTDAWLLKFIKSPQAVIDSKDKVADSLLQVYKVMMPDHPTLKDDQIHEILAYIKDQSSAPVAAATSTTTDIKDVKKSGFDLTKIDVILLAGIAFLLVVIFSLARINKNLSEQIKDFYSSDRSFF
ncbi:MAG TPA: c-type cytochrome [Saprospiraceae bacterium]|nr:c-type cytochrome [Saprospiraceae bacterium]HQW55060.1 c-type cytochrome [Saprospiraceae bacterium]